MGTSFTSIIYTRLATFPSRKISGRDLGKIEGEVDAYNRERYEHYEEKAAKILGIGERTLYRKIKEYNL